MPKYCLDSNFFILAHRGPYAMDIMPGFWDWIDSEAVKGNLFSSSFVYDELLQGKDILAGWAKDRKDSDLFIPPSNETQANFIDISDFVVKNYQEAFAKKFLDCADPWVIAQALEHKSKVVTFEKLVNAESKKIKIPNICKEFEVEWLDTYQMMREMKAKIRNAY